MIKERTKTVTLTFLREQLLYDIKNIAYVEGDVLPDESQHSKHQVQDIGDEGNIDRVTRMLDLALARCREHLYPYTKEPVEGGELLDDVLFDTSAYFINMLVPDDFSTTTVKYLEQLIHNLLVYYVLADWMSIANVANADSAANWAAKAEDAEEEIKGVLNSRVGRVRKFQSPF
jgi:hypothetical protein